MSKGNMLLGQARGKVGDLVFARAYGKQIVRSKAQSVANPKTIGQNTQRAILATIAKSAAAMNSLVDHSFANIPYGAESVRHFRKINMGLLRNLYLNTQNDANLVAKGGSFVPNPLKVSEGNLPSFVSIVDSGDIGFLQDTNHPLPSSGDITVSDFLKAFPSLKGGDQITLVKITKVNDGDLVSGDALFAISLDRIVFAPNAFDDLGAVIITEADGEIDDTLLDLTKTTNPTCVTLNPETGGLGFSTDHDMYYAALILSRKVNNNWQRSTQYLEQIEFNDHADNESAIASYGAMASVSDETEYLNQADEGETPSGVSDAYMGVTTTKAGSSPSYAKVNANSSDSTSIQAASGTVVDISAQAFAPAGKRIVTVEVDRPNGTYAAHGAKSVNYSVAITSETAGTWKIIALFDDGSRAQYGITLSVAP